MPTRHTTSQRSPGLLAWGCVFALPDPFRSLRRPSRAQRTDKSNDAPRNERANGHGHLSPASWTAFLVAALAGSSLPARAVTCRESNPRHAGTNWATKGAAMSRNPQTVAVSLLVCAIAVSATVGCSCSANISGTTPNNGGAMNRNGGPNNNSGGGTSGNSGNGMMGGSRSNASTGSP